jgi:peptide-methionine (S)-S-oxide reductase
VVQVKFDPKIIDHFEEVLEVFWNTHDPTTLTNKGADEGTQYRSVVFYHNDAQKKIAEEYKAQLNQSQVYNNPVVTEISPFTEFYPAENYHQNYYELNPTQSYCAYVIRPKVEKFRKQYEAKLKRNNMNNKYLSLTNVTLFLSPRFNTNEQRKSSHRFRFR